MVRAPHAVLLTSSYVLDWIILIVIAAIGAGFSQIGPRKRPFDLTDPAISYPLETETVTNSTLILATLVVPAAIIFVGSLLIPASGKTDVTGSLRRKLWEWNTGWMGLALAYAVAFTITNGAKEVLGKLRPNFLARCAPNFAQQTKYAVGGVGDQFGEGITIYDWRICQNRGSLLDEGYRSFPSGHSSLAFAGMLYLAFWLCAKLGVAIPFLSVRVAYSVAPSHAGGLRTRNAAPPVYLLVFPLIPVGGAIYIASTRYSDYWHHGFDVLTSAILGSITAWLGFRWYHMPIQEGGGWVWAPRSPRRAYWKGMGVSTYGDDSEDLPSDLESTGLAHVRSASPHNLQRTRLATSDESGGSYEMDNFAAAMQAPRHLAAH